MVALVRPQPWSRGTDPARAAATALTLTGPSTSSVGAASSVFTVALSPVGSESVGAITVTPDDAGDGGTFSPATVLVSGPGPTATFTYTAASAGAKSIGITNSGGLSDPADVVCTASVYVPSWITAQTVNTWGTIPASNTLASLNPDNDPLINPNHPATAPWRSTGNWATITTAWCGMAFDDATATGWWVDAGGHNDQHANGVIKLELNQEVPVFSWVRYPSGSVGEPTIAGAEWTVSPQVAEFSDGRPRARHTVNMTFFWPGYGPGNITEILLSPGGGYEAGRLKPYLVSQSTGERTHLGPNKLNEGGGGWCASCYDPVRDVAWKMPSATSQKFSHWGGPTSDVWTDVGSSTYYLADSVSMCHIPGHDVILIGNGGDDLVASGGSAQQTIVGGWAVLDPVTGVLHYPTFTGAPATAPNGDASGLWPGICQPRWAASLGAALAWDMSTGHTTKVLRIMPPAVGDPRTDAWTIDYLTVDGSNAVTPSAASVTGTYGKFWVWDEMRVCGVLNAANEAGFFFRYG